MSDRPRPLTPTRPAPAVGDVGDLVDAVEQLAEALAPGSVAAVDRARDPDDEEDEWPSMLPPA